ncbi:hypothetical protein PNOK_0902700 [Pyrrhoderma noxium]|uniref:Uncharacterized protein n=1 Tax=Pyrrhoderma noxium TaxID=2282107 RepID=A0A286U6R2_9AGAM|nr:hypothetical protein PNOK_0902700 [Pyrrhoderma noxium]
MYSIIHPLKQTSHLVSLPSPHPPASAYPLNFTNFSVFTFEMALKRINKELIDLGRDYNGSGRFSLCGRFHLQPRSTTLISMQMVPFVLISFVTNGLPLLQSPKSCYQFAQC